MICNERMPTKDSQLELLNQLSDLGFVHNLQYQDGHMLCIETGQKFLPEELTLEALYRFEGPSDPEYSNMVCAFRAKDGTGAIFIDAFGTHGDPAAAEFCRKVPDNRAHSELMLALPATKSIVIQANHVS